MIKLYSQTRQWFSKATLNFATQMLWSKTSVVHKPPTNNTTDRTSERLTLQQQLKSFRAKHTRRNGSRSPSIEQSTTKSNDQPKDQEIEKLKQVNETGNIT